MSTDDKIICPTCLTEGTTDNHRSHLKSCEICRASCKHKHFHKSSLPCNTCKSHTHLTKHHITKCALCGKNDHATQNHMCDICGRNHVHKCETCGELGHDKTTKHCGHCGSGQHRTKDHCPICDRTDNCKEIWGRWSCDNSCPVCGRLCDQHGGPPCSRDPCSLCGEPTYLDHFMDCKVQRRMERKDDSRHGGYAPWQVGAFGGAIADGPRM